MSRRILFIEDQTAFAIGVMDRLNSEGYGVELAQNGEDGFERAKQGTFDLVICDVMLPGKNGFDIARDLRTARVTTPILMLTARGEIVDRVVGLKLGADDYMVKPFDVLELLARIEALLRRGAGQSARAMDRFEFGEIQVDLTRNEATRAGAPLPFSRGELRLLKYLLDHRGTIITREELLDKVWGVEPDTLSRTVDVHIAGLRKKIEPDPRYPQFLITVKGFGYKMVV
ncbi:MAG: response regulator transcription factor [Acidobacteriota bacterium]|nr:response regulator transcription factor [Acidobacteriota bacterium]